VGTVTIAAVDKAGVVGGTTFNYVVYGFPSGTLSFTARNGVSPKLTQKVTAAARTTLTKVAITLPSSISMASTKDVRVETTGGKVVKISELAHRLVVTFSRASAATITVTSPSIKISSALASKIRKKTTETVMFTTVIVDRAGPIKALSTQIKLP